MSYYDNGSQWSGAPGPQGSNVNANSNVNVNASAANPPAANNWDHQAPQVRAARWKTGAEPADLTLSKPANATGPTAADEFAFSYQFDGLFFSGFPSLI